MSETVKVRVAVAVDPQGDWNACGWSKGAESGHGSVNDPTPASDGEASEAAREHVRGGERIYWLTAELPIPKPAAPVEIPAGVEEGGK